MAETFCSVGATMSTIPAFFRRRMNRLTGEVGASVNECLLTLSLAVLVIAGLASSNIADTTRQNLRMAGGGSTTNNDWDGSVIIQDPACTDLSRAFGPVHCCGTEQGWLLPCEPDGDSEDTQVVPNT